MVTGEDRKRNDRGTKKVPTDGHQENWTLTEFIPFVQFHLPIANPPSSGLSLTTTIGYSKLLKKQRLELCLMKITVSLHGVFRIDRFKLETLDYPDGSSAQKVIDDLQIPARLLGTILINQVHAKQTDILHNGDTLMILPLLEGG